MNCANECTSLDCRFQKTQEWAASTKAWRDWACEGGTLPYKVLSYGAAEPRCIWRSSLRRLMAHCEENVPRRRRTKIKWAASLLSLVWLVVLSRRLILRGNAGPGLHVHLSTRNDARHWHTILAPRGIISHALIVQYASHARHEPGHLTGRSWQEVCFWPAGRGERQQ